MDWFRWWLENVNGAAPEIISDNAKIIADIAHENAMDRRSCLANWLEVEKKLSLDMEHFSQAFLELERLGVIFHGFPSVLIALADLWPLPPMFGSINGARPCPSVWKKVREAIFKRDNYTCRYCGSYGVKLECDHVIPVSRGGSHEDSNLVTACFKCNRSKRDKLIEEWRQ